MSPPIIFWGGMYKKRKRRRCSYQDRSFTFVLKTPPTPVLIKKALGLETASARPNRDKVGKLTKAQVEEIAKTKMPDLNCSDIEAAKSMVKGTARSMGVTVEE